MAASDPQGEMQFWFNGLPFAGVQKSGNDGGEMQFWFNGLPYQFIFPQTSGQPIIKRIATIPFLGGSLRQRNF